MSSPHPTESQRNEAYGELHREIDGFVNEDHLGNRLELISSSFYSSFLWMVGADPYREVDHNKTFALRESHISALFDTLQIMVHLAKIYDQWAIAERLEDEMKKEVSHEK